MNDEWRTPGWLFGIAQAEFGSFDTDLAATADNALVPNYITKVEDALSPALHWPSFGERLWCNPPYSRIGPWLEKAAACKHSVERIVFLIPSPNGESRDRLLFEHASRLIFFDKRISFLMEDGRPKNGNPRGSCLAEFSARQDGALINTQLIRL